MYPPECDWYKSLAAKPPPPLMYELIRELVPGERGYWGESHLRAGTRVYKFAGNTHSIYPLPGGVMISEHGPKSYPCFEAPLDALKVVDDGAGSDSASD